MSQFFRAHEDSSHDVVQLKNSHVKESELTPWIFEEEDVKQTPTRIQQMSECKESGLVVMGAVFLQKCGQILKLPPLTVTNAIVLYQRFFMLQSMTVQAPYLIASVCLLLSTKEQEKPQVHLRDIVYCAVRLGMNRKEVLEDREYIQWGKRILDKERLVLRVLNFDVTVHHPSQYLTALTELYLGRGEWKKRALQTAEKVLFDSFKTNIHVLYYPREIATAVMFLSFQLENISVPMNSNVIDVLTLTDNVLPEWYTRMASDCDLARIEKICRKILEMYESEGSVYRNR